MAEPVRHVTVVGGGTAGWLTALSLYTFLNNLRDGPRLKVTVIESPTRGTIGVGEATVVSVSQIMRQLGISEAEFIHRCNASFKMAVRFQDWSARRNGEPRVFHHPLNVPSDWAGFNLANFYKRFGPPPDCVDLADSVLPNSALVRARRAPRTIDSKDYEAPLPYAYHLDAGLFGQMMRDLALERGVEHLPDDVLDCELDERGFVAALQLERGGRFPVELLVDCSGFSSIFMRGKLDEPFLSYDDHLLCDRAIPVQLPHPDPRAIEPCTRATGLGAGWVWRVPLYNRIGTGYVYSSRFRSDDQARDEFFAHLRACGDLPAGAPEPETRVIKMRVGRTRRAWVKNVVAIGLSSGFIEPLEATAIYTIEVASRLLVAYFPDREMSEPLVARYNALMQSLYEEVRDFVVTHYVTGDRSDPFWQAARHDIVVPDSVQQRLAAWRHVLPNAHELPSNKLFNHWNYLFSLWPKGFFDGQHYPLQDAVSARAWQAYCAKLAQQKRHLLATLPDHHELLTRFRQGREPVGEVPAAAAAPVAAPRPVAMPQTPTVPVPSASNGD